MTNAHYSIRKLILIMFFLVPYDPNNFHAKCFLSQFCDLLSNVPITNDPHNLSKYVICLNLNPLFLCFLLNEKVKLPRKEKTSWEDELITVGASGSPSVGDWDVSRINQLRNHELVDSIGEAVDSLDAVQMILENLFINVEELVVVFEYVSTDDAGRRHLGVKVLHFLDDFEVEMVSSCCL